MTVDVEDEDVLVRVADDGPGVPPAEVESLRTGETGDPLHHGTGLGLLVVYWVVRLSGGSLSFDESDLGGSLVTLRLEQSTSGPAEHEH